MVVDDIIIRSSIDPETHLGLALLSSLRDAAGRRDVHLPRLPLGPALAATETAPTPVQASIMDRYRGTEYDHGDLGAGTDAAAMTPSRASKSANRVRTIVVVAFIAVLGLYGTMLVYTDFESHKDQPAAAFGIHR